jgi:hypothetical protein
LNFGACGRLGVETWNAPQGVGVSVDMGGAAPAVGSRRILGTYRTATGFIGNAGATNLASTGPDVTIFAELANNQASLLFVAPGTPDPTQNGKTAGGVSADPNFDANGDRINNCPKYTCTNPSFCNDPTGGTATCDTATGEWVVPNDVTVSTATLSCPMRIRGNFRATTSLTIRACARIHVTGVAILAGQTDTDRIPVTFDLNEYGIPRSGNQIPWLSADGGIIGGVAGGSFSNIWDPLNTVNLVNQLCGNAYSLIIYPFTGVRPGDTCGASAANAISDEIAVQDDFMGDLAIVDDVQAQVTDFPGDFAVVDDVQTQVTDFTGDLAIVDDVQTQVTDFMGDLAVDDGFMDAAAADSQATFATTSSNAIPAYGIALIVLAVLLVVGLIVIQVQLLLLYRGNSMRA